MGVLVEIFDLSTTTREDFSRIMSKERDSFDTSPRHGYAVDLI